MINRGKAIGLDLSVIVVLRYKAVIAEVLEVSFGAFSV